MDRLSITDGRRDTSAYLDILTAVWNAHTAIKKDRWRSAFWQMADYANLSREDDDSRLAKRAAKTGDWKTALKHYLPSVFRHYYSMSNCPEMIIHDWYSTVEQFSERHFTYENDRLPAISGVATDFRKKSKDRYIAGLWERHVLSGLAWHQMRRIEAKDPDKWQRLEMRRRSFGQAVTAPSWSWASAAGGVQFHGKESSEILDATYLGCDITLASDENILGQVRNGALKLQAPLRRVYASWFLDRLENKHEGLVDSVRVPTYKIMEAMQSPTYWKTTYPDDDRELLFALQGQEEPLAYPEDPFWLMRLFHQVHDDRTVTSRGLVLFQNGDGTFRRVGYYDDTSPWYPYWLVRVQGWLGTGAYELRTIVVV